MVHTPTLQVTCRGGGSCKCARTAGGKPPLLPLCKRRAEAPLLMAGSSSAAPAQESRVEPGKLGTTLIVEFQC